MDLTSDQVAGRKAQAVRFVQDVLGDDDRADEIAAESVQDYADRRRITIIENPRGAMTNAQLEEQIRDLEEENDDLRERLNQVIDVAAADEDDEEGEEGEDEEAA